MSMIEMVIEVCDKILVAMIDMVSRSDVAYTKQSSARRSSVDSPLCCAEKKLQPGIDDE